MPEKTPTTQPVPTMKHHFISGAIAAGIIFAILLLIWIPFKVIPALFAGSSNFFATTLSSTFIPATSTDQIATTTATTNTTQPVKDTTTGLPATRTISNVVYAPTQPYYYGKPDLAVSLVGVGIIDPGTGQFFNTGYAGQNDTIAVKFDVRNIGTNVSGPWDLRLNMPSRTTPYFDSGSQQSIRPGDRIEYVATFQDPISQGINTAYITVDPLNAIDESNESNNALTVPITVSGTTYSYNNQYNYGGNTQTTTGSMYTWTNINANCYANPQTSYAGNVVTWYATASGGNGYFTYNWNGSDGLTSTNSSVPMTYYTSGSKIASVTITSNGVSVTKQCSMYVY